MNSRATESTRLRASKRARSLQTRPVREVSIANRHPRLTFDRKEILRMMGVLDADSRIIISGTGAMPAGELSLVFLTDATLAKLHADFLDDPTTTDVITFEGNPQLGTAGEVCVSADTAATYAKTHGRDFSAELTLYLVHGWLHLAGHDDLKPAKKREMRRAESRAMRALQRANAIPKFTLRSR